MGCCFSKEDDSPQHSAEMSYKVEAETSPQDGLILNHPAAVNSALRPPEPARDDRRPSPTARPRMANHYVALYDLPAKDSLPFQKGDEFVVLDYTNDDWYKARHLGNNQEGYIPSSYIAKYGSLQSFAWYFDNIGRLESGNMLKKSVEGSYLVRPSETRQGCFSLSVKVPSGGIKHYIIRHSMDTDKYFINPSAMFDSIHELIEYFKTHPGNLGYQLTEPAQPLASRPDLVLNTWEVQREHIELGTKLGNGAFGIVYRGTFMGKQEVAIKTLNEGTMDKDAFLAEAELMKKLKHKNVLSLLAIHIATEPMMIVTELMSNGALLDYLRKPASREKLKPKDLIDMAAQCANGMSYLEINGYIHRDLAARNVLVSSEGQCKIADFGLSKLDEEYSASSNTRFPVRWTAPEAALFGQYSIKSDVWSFGVLLYEIITYGKIPYAGKSNKDVMEMLDNKEKIDQPKCCPDPYYKLIMNCHRDDPEERPTFETLRYNLEDYFFGTTEHQYE